MAEPDGRQTVRLSAGIQMPQLGLGTFPLNGINLALLVRRAVGIGYRLFDLARAYHNEKWFGRGVKMCGTARSGLFISTKLSNTDQFAGDVRGAFLRSLEDLGTDYVDCYLMHWPVPECFPRSWKEMEKLYEEGVARSIGVCNFHRHHLERLLGMCSVPPAVNQIELHPLLAQRDLVAFCEANGIRIQAYSPFARMHERLVGSSVLGDIAKRHHKTVPQVILRWDIQHGYITVPKSGSFARLRENFAVFDFALSDDEVGSIDALDIGFRVRHDPDTCDYRKL